MEIIKEKNPVIVSNLRSVPDFASEIKKDKRTVYNWVKEGKVKLVSFLGKTWIDVSTLKS